jgi:hypothetical protein
MKSKLISLSIFCALAPFSLAGQGAVDPMQKWESTDYRTQVISAASLKGSNAELVRGIIFGKHGRIFKEKDIQAYLSSRPWYKPNPNFKNSELNDDERQNLDTVRGVEAVLHKKIEPGDMRFWKDQDSIDSTQVVTDPTSVHILIAEVEAIHGKTFPSEPELQAYFNDRYWYKPDPNYNSKSLDVIEKDDLKVLIDVEKHFKGEEVGPGDMHLYKSKALFASALAQCSLFDLRLMRNEFYAMNGYKFKTPWLQRHFAMINWYKPTSKVVNLTGVQKANVAAILARENAIHDGLTTKLLDKRQIDDLYIEDITKLENEIYAKHGKVFRQRWLQDYFESFPWYKRNPKFSVANLSAVEKSNLHLLAEVSEEASSVMNAEEG